MGCGLRAPIVLGLRAPKDGEGGPFQTNASQNELSFTRYNMLRTVVIVFTTWIKNLIHIRHHISDLVGRVIKKSK